MDGTRHKEVIQAWFDSVIKDGGIDRYDDLHVDQIDAAWEPQGSWITAALASFEIAVEIRNMHGSDLDLNVLLSIPLESDVEPLGVTFHCCEDLEKSLSYVPPSLYILRSDSKIMREAKVAEESSADWKGNLKLLNGTEIFGGMRESVKCFYSESKRPDDEEYSRYLYLIG
jgi:hypothetical protein